MAPIRGKVGIAGCFLTRKIGPAVARRRARCRFPAPAHAGIGDLLVAPTRIVLDGRKGTEVVLNNIGDAPATYRISVEFRRMTADGSLEDVTEPTAQEKEAEDMIVYAPRRVTLAPHEPQSIRSPRGRRRASRRRISRPPAVSRHSARTPVVSRPATQTKGLVSS